MSNFPVFETMASLPRSMARSLVALPRSCHDLGKDAMINHVLGKGSMVTNPFFGTSQCSKTWYPSKIHVAARRYRRYFRFAFRSYSLDVIALNF